MESNVRGNLTMETERKTQATTPLILKSPPENKICCPHLAQDKKKIMKQVTLIAELSRAQSTIGKKIW